MTVLKELFYEYFAVKLQSNFMENTHQGLFDLQMDPAALDSLKEGARWARFISLFFLIIMLLGVVCMIVLLPFIKKALPEIEANLPNIPYYILEWIYPIVAAIIVLAAISLYAYYKLYAFAMNAKRAVTQLDQYNLESSAAHLKTFMKLLAVLGIIGLAMNVAGAVVVYMTLNY
jgi:uncharacterized BrkB/YihY/UPF0761 family membrane protein